MLRRAKSRIEGHLNYYAITDNLWRCSAYRHYVTRILFKWLNRKSQRRSYTWKGYLQALRYCGTVGKPGGKQRRQTSAYSRGRPRSTRPIHESREASKNRLYQFKALMKPQDLIFAGLCPNVGDHSQGVNFRLSFRFPLL